MKYRYSETPKKVDSDILQTKKPRVVYTIKLLDTDFHEPF